MIEQHLYSRLTPPPSFQIKGEYKALSSAGTARAGHAAGVINNKMYVFGGSHTLLNNVMEVYDIATDTWNTLSTTGVPTPRHSPGCCVLDDKLYVFGGSITAAWAPTAEAYVFNPANNTWTKLANMPAALCLQSAVAIKGKIYLFGGFNGSSSINNFYEYDPVSNTYRAIAHTQASVHGHKAVNVNDEMFLVGGVSTVTLLSRCVSYDPVANAWKSYAPSPLGNTYTFTAALEDYLYMFGGSLNTNTTTHNRLFKFHPASNSWTELPSGATAGYFGMMVALADRLFLHGGRNSSTLYSMLWEIT